RRPGTARSARADRAGRAGPRRPAGSGRAGPRPSLALPGSAAAPSRRVTIVNVTPSGVIVGKPPHRRVVLRRSYASRVILPPVRVLIAEDERRLADSNPRRLRRE